mgnify:FL=1
MTHRSCLRRALALLLTLLLLSALALPVFAAEDAPEADTDAQNDPFAALTWWVIPLALLIALLGGGALRLLLRTPERWTQHYEKKYDRFTPKSPKNEKEERK